MTGQRGTGCGTADPSDVEATLVDVRGGRGTAARFVWKQPPPPFGRRVERISGACGTRAESIPAPFHTRRGAGCRAWAGSVWNGAASWMWNPHQVGGSRGHWPASSVTTLRPDVIRGWSRLVDAVSDSTAAGESDYRSWPSHVKFTSTFTWVFMRGGRLCVGACACARGDRIRPSQPVTRSNRHER